MKFSEAWLREWVDPDITTEQLAEQLSMAGLEVDSVEPAAVTFDGVVVGSVLTREQHPDADEEQTAEGVDRRHHFRLQDAHAVAVFDREASACADSICP